MLKGGSSSLKGKGKGKSVAVEPVAPAKSGSLNGKGKPVAMEPAALVTGKGKPVAMEPSALVTGLVESIAVEPVAPAIDLAEQSLLPDKRPPRKRKGKPVDAELVAPAVVPLPGRADFPAVLPCKLASQEMVLEC